MKGEPTWENQWWVKSWHTKLKEEADICSSKLEILPWVLHPSSVYKLWINIVNILGVN